MRPRRPSRLRELLGIGPTRNPAPLQFNFFALHLRKFSSRSEFSRNPLKVYGEIKLGIDIAVVPAVKNIFHLGTTDYLFQGIPITLSNSANLTILY